MYLANRNVSTIAKLAKVIFGLEGSQHILVSSIMLQQQLYTERLPNYSFATFTLISKFLDFKSMHEHEKYIDLCLCLLML